MPASITPSLPASVATNQLFKWTNVPFTASVNAVDGLVAAATNILTVPAGYKFVCQGGMVRLNAVTGAATVGVARIRDVTGAQDLVGNTTLTGLTAAGGMIPLPLPTSVNFQVAAGSVIAVELTTAFTVATVVTLSFDVWGYLVS